MNIDEFGKELQALCDEYGIDLIADREEGLIAYDCIKFEPIDPISSVYCKNPEILRKRREYLSQKRKKESQQLFDDCMKF